MFLNMPYTPWFEPDKLCQSRQRRRRWRVIQHTDFPKAPFDLCFTPDALEELLATVGARPPESGAKGFGPTDRLGFDRVEFDNLGSSTAGGAVYSPDVSWGNERCEHYLSLPEPKTRLWTGDIHSHPGSFGLPSGRAGKALGDLGYVDEVFEQNEAMQWFLMPILTQTATEEIVIHPWVRHRNGTLLTAKLRVCKVKQFPPREFNPEWEQNLTDMPMVETSHELLNSTSERITVQTALPSVPASLIQKVPPTYSQWHDNLKKEDILTSYTTRLAGIVSSDFHTKTVLVVGTGAGSYAAEKIARFCPQRIKLCDFDTVAIPNLARTCFTYTDAVAGKLKVYALAERIAEINPLVEIQVNPQSITSLSQPELEEMFQNVDLVMAGTDNFEAQALINKLAFLKGIPAVFIGIHANAQGGRVVWTLPGLTPCYRCVARERYEASVNPESASLDLVAAHGSLVDCQFIDMVALKAAIAILDRGRDSTMGHFFRRMGHRNDIVVRCDPEYAWGNALWDAMLGDLPTEPKDFAKELRDVALLAMDTIWLPGAKNPNCPICGSIASSVDVMA